MKYIQCSPNCAARSFSESKDAVWYNGLSNRRSGDGQRQGGELYMIGWDRESSHRTGPMKESGRVGMVSGRVGLRSTQRIASIMPKDAHLRGTARYALHPFNSSSQNTTVFFSKTHRPRMRPLNLRRLLFVEMSPTCMPVVIRRRGSRLTAHIEGSPEVPFAMRPT